MKPWECRKGNNIPAATAISPWPATAKQEEAQRAKRPKMAAARAKTRIVMVMVVAVMVCVFGCEEGKNSQSEGGQTFLSRAISFHGSTHHIGRRKATASPTKAEPAHAPSISDQTTIHGRYAPALWTLQPEPTNHLIRRLWQPTVLED